MRYLVIGCNNDLDTIVSMYMYYMFIQNAGFDVYCYGNDRIKNIFESLGINVKFDCDITDDDKIIVLNNNKFIIPDIINNDMVTEIISLRNCDFSKFVDANIKIDNVKLLITLIIERYREYKIDIATDVCKILQKVFNENISKLSERDKIAFDYINILCKDII